MWRFNGKFYQIMPALSSLAHPGHWIAMQALSGSQCSYGRSEIAHLALSQKTKASMADQSLRSASKTPYEGSIRESAAPAATHRCHCSSLLPTHTLLDNLEDVPLAHPNSQNQTIYVSHWRSDKPDIGSLSWERPSLLTPSHGSFPKLVIAPLRCLAGLAFALAP